MIQTYFKVAWRSLKARLFYTLLNVLGLALAMGCCILLYVYVSYQQSFDTYHRHANTTYRIVNELHLDKTEYDKGSSLAMFLAAWRELPQVVNGAFSISRQSYMVTAGAADKKLFREEKNIAFTTSKWFDVFKYQVLAGNVQGLNKMNTAVLTQKQAQKYFGSAPAVGQYLQIKNIPMRVVAIVADRPYNTDQNSEVYFSFATLKQLDPDYKNYSSQWGYIASVNNSYLTLRRAADKAAVEALLNRMAKPYFGDGIKYYKFQLLPLTEQHFDLRYGGTTQKSLLTVLIVIGSLILATAIINYINLVVAQQARRSAEIGTRKVLGDTAGRLLMQFVTESVLTTTAAALLAMGLVVTVLPVINCYWFSAQPIYVGSWWALGLFTLALVIIINLVMGIYPAWWLNRFNITHALKKQATLVQTGLGRKALVILQNLIAQLLIAGTVIIVMQVQFLKNTDKGFDRNMVVTIPVGQATDLQKQRLLEGVNEMPDISSVSFCLNSPATDSQRGATLQFDNRAKWETWPARFAIGDAGYAGTFGLKVIAGRNRNPRAAVPEFLINQKMARMLMGNRWTNVVGKNLQPGDIKGVIVGVVKDFNVHSLLEPIEPTVVLEDKGLQANMAVKLNGQHTDATLKALQLLYTETLPAEVFSYRFIDEQIASLYRAETLQQNLIWGAAAMAIVISSLGLLGLVSLMTLQRTKEIGVRKVLGAGVSQIGLMLSADFLKLVGISLVVAIPGSWWLMNSWLQNYAYHIQIHWWVYALTGVLAMLIAFLTVGFQSFKAAMANPVNSLRSE